MIYITGDTHGGVDINKLVSKNFSPKGLTKDDYVVILGDFGFIWNNTPDKTEQYWLNWFDVKPWTTLFIDGNHENFNRLNAYPITYWNGGKVHKITDSIIHLMRGQVYTLQSKKFFTFGGANSIDKHLRQEDISWWKGELPSYSEQEEAYSNLESSNFTIDYVLTHTCPQSVMYKLLELNVISSLYEDPTEKLLEQLNSLMTYSHWYFGHYHTDLDIDKFTCVYNEVIQLE